MAIWSVMFVIPVLALIEVFVQYTTPRSTPGLGSKDTTGASAATPDDLTMDEHHFDVSLPTPPPLPPLSPSSPNRFVFLQPFKEREVINQDGACLR